MAIITLNLASSLKKELSVYSARSVHVGQEETVFRRHYYNVAIATVLQCQFYVQRWSLPGDLSLT